MKPGPVLTLILLAAGILQGCTRGAPSPPSILLVSIDTLRADRLNCYGYQQRIVSPHLDALAREAVLFEQQVAAAPWTTPSHMSLFTSLRPTAHGVTSSFAELNRGLLSGARIPELSLEIPTLAQVLRARWWQTAAFTGGVTVDPRIGFGRGFELYDTSMGKLGDKNVGRLLHWIERHRDQRTFLFWHTFEVHAPYLSGDFLGEVMPPGEARRLSRDLGRLRRHARAPSAADGRSILERDGAFSARVSSALYDGGIRSVDARLGQVIAQLRALGLYDDTLIVVTSDHGEQLGERDGRHYDTHGRTLYEEMIHVPLIVKLPGQAFGGRRVSAVTRAVDVMPTILDLAQVPATGLHMQGESLRPLWASAGGGRERLALSESTAMGYELKSLRSRRAKYILRLDPETLARGGRAQVPDPPDGEELFDLVADPAETTNRLARGAEGARRSADAQVAARLEADLRARVAARIGRAGTVQVEDDSLEQLRALGYIK